MTDAPCIICNHSKSQRDMSGKTCCYFHNDTFCHRNFGHRSTHSQWSQTRICTLCRYKVGSYNNVSIIPTTYQHYLHFLRTGLVPTIISVDASMSQHIHIYFFVCVAIWYFHISANQLYNSRNAHWFELNPKCDNQWAYKTKKYSASTI